MALSRKRRKFVEEYLKCWNATEAARVAGYAHPRQQGSRLLSNVDIAAEIQDRIAADAMDADEVLRRLGEQARASVGDFITINEKTGVWDIELSQAQSDGKLHLIKELWTDKDGNTRLRLHDSQSALVQMGRAHGVFRDRLEHSIRLEDVLAALPDDFREAVRRELAASIS